MNAEDYTNLQNRIGDMEEVARILWSTLEAIHDAMRAEFSVPETYQDAVYGVSQQAYGLKEELRMLLEWFLEEEANRPHGEKTGAST